jgi:hypothetical protein
MEIGAPVPAWKGTAAGECESCYVSRAAVIIEQEIPGSEQEIHERRRNGRLAQLVRASGLHPEGRRFESCTAHHTTVNGSGSYGEIAKIDRNRAARNCAHPEHSGPVRCFPQVVLLRMNVALLPLEDSTVHVASLSGRREDPVSFKRSAIHFKHRLRARTSLVARTLQSLRLSESARAGNSLSPGSTRRGWFQPARTA